MHSLLEAMSILPAPVLVCSAELLASAGGSIPLYQTPFLAWVQLKPAVTHLFIATFTFMGALVSQYTGIKT